MIVVPLILTDPLRFTLGLERLNVEVTVALPFTIMWQTLLLDEVQPAQLPNTEPIDAVAVRSTSAPWTTVSEHAPGQLIWPSPLWTLPVPAPARDVVNVKLSVPIVSGAEYMTGTA